MMIKVAERCRHVHSHAQKRSNRYHTNFRDIVNVNVNVLIIIINSEQKGVWACTADAGSADGGKEGSMQRDGRKA